MKYQLAITAICLLFIHSQVQSQIQAPPHPEFSSFKGTVYKMPIVEMISKRGTKFKGLQERYDENVYDYPVLQEIELDHLEIPETFIDEGKFPGGVERNTQYAMVLYSGMQITHKACYEFSLNSDDGSILWIDGEEIINNDGGHEMTFKNDSLIYEPGLYEIKVWYFQGLADRFGLELKAKIVGKPEVCPSAAASAVSEKLEFNSKVFFTSGSAELRTEAQTELARIATLISSRPTGGTITVIGHTDNVGTGAANQLLSQRRAQAIATALLGLVGEDYTIRSEGKGELSPIADNATEEGRLKNRRVEIFLKFL